MRTPTVLSLLICLTGSALAQSQSPHDSQTIAVGPWTIATTFKAEKFDSCTMGRTAGELEVSFVRSNGGLLLLLDSPKWKLERGKLYAVRLVEGSRSVDAKASADSKSVTIELADQTFNERLRMANVLQVQGKGATLRVPLQGSAAAFRRLESCFEKNSHEGTEENPFVAPSRSP